MNEGRFDPGSIPPELLSGALSRISEHPELISMVASALGGGDAPTEDKETPASASPSPSGDPAALLGAIGPIMSALGKSHRKSPREEHRDALLCALKPYLSEERRRSIDQIMKLGQLGDILKIIK